MNRWNVGGPPPVARVQAATPFDMPSRATAWGLLSAFLLAAAAVVVAPHCAIGMPVAAAATDTVEDASDLTRIGLEDLMKLEVTSASRHEQVLSNVASAITVIGRDQIRASGATTLAEVLRMVPEMQVAHIDANIWSISARGFSGRIANKLLLLVDGRSVYSPIFAGVYWDEQDLLLEDIERIEVIRGPGASVWGANAMNGVINVITRDAHDTRGAALGAAAGNEELGGGSARWGGTLGTRGAFRVFARGASRAGSAIPGTAENAWDSWSGLHAGFRADVPVSDRTRWTLTGDLRSGDAGQSIYEAIDSPPYKLQVSPRTTVKGGNLMASWQRKLSAYSDITLQGYTDVSDRNDDVLQSHVETYDLEFKNHVSNGRSEFVWGLGGRVVRDRLDSTAVLYFAPDHEARSMLSAFAQDEIVLDNRHVRLTLGTRVESSYDAASSARPEWQPSIRAQWSPGERHSLWGAVSRAVRTPSRAENDIRYHLATMPTGGPPAEVTIYGDSAFQSEILVAYEAGYRFAPTPAVMFDVSSYYNEYSRLRTVEPGSSTFSPTPTPHIDVRESWENKMHGDTRGIGGSIAWSVSRNWKLNANASCLVMRLHLDPGSQDVSSVSGENNEPAQQYMLQSQFQFTPRWRWDATAYQIGRRPSQSMPGYTRLDLGLAWQVRDGAELSLMGMNLLQRRHYEDDGVQSGLIPTQVERSFTARVSVLLGSNR